MNGLENAISPSLYSPVQYRTILEKTEQCNLKKIFITVYKIKDITSSNIICTVRMLPARYLRISGLIEQSII